MNHDCIRISFSVVIRACLLAITVSLLAPAAVQAQSVGIGRDTLMGEAGDTLSLSQPFLVPFSDSLWNEAGKYVSPVNYELSYGTGRLIVPIDSGAGKHWVVHYRYFEDGPKPELALRKFKIVQDTSTFRPQVDVMYDPSLQVGQEMFWEEEEGGIRKSGSLSRGLTVGNNRNLSLTSGLRLQLEGDLGDGLKIVGAITDENLPIQPDGTTQQISDFDKVFIKLMKDDFQVTIGDFEVSRKGSQFADYYRNVQGLQFQRQNEQSTIRVSGAVAKGKFHTNTLQGIDGVSGPYQLTGQNGERFFIVLAGSEKIFLNGKLLTRGETNDYIINYNTAEITFTAQHVITNISRIVVDFEYNDQYYNRSLLVADVKQSFLDDKLQLTFSYGRDADNPNAPFDNPQAFQQVRDSLAQVGDRSDLAVTSGIFELGYEQGESRYERRDTLLGAEEYVYYARSNNPDSAIYFLDFSFVGPGQGNYDPLVGINENAFIWVAPGPGGEPQGSYEPQRRWVLPRILQVADAEVSYQLSKHLKVYSETAVSSEDQNRLSAKGDEDNIDMANRSGIRLEDVSLSDSLRLTVEAFHQYVGQRYTNLDRVYQAEYNRVWDLEADEARENENITTAKMRLRHLKGVEVEAEGGVRLTGPGNLGTRQVYSVKSRLPRFFQGNFTYTRITKDRQSLAKNSVWNRYEGNVFLPYKTLRTGVEIWMEDRQQLQSDSLSIGSFAFMDLKPYIRTAATKKLQLDLSFNYRRDREWLAGQQRDKSLAYTAYFRSTYRPSALLNLQQTSSYRRLDVQDSLFTANGLQNSRTLNTQWQGAFQTKNRLIRTNFIYDVSAERLARREVRYIEVNPGQGQYVWLDSLFNRDGIQDVEEFQLANNPLIADFIRIVVPTRELFPTTQLTLSGNLGWDFKEVIAKSKQFFPELARNLRLNTDLRMSQNKNQNNRFGSYFIALTDPFGDTTLLSATYNLRQDLSLFQNHPTGDIRFSYLDSRAKLFLSTGDEFRVLTFWRANQRLNLGNARSLEAETRWGVKSNLADAFPSRTYDISFIETSPQLNVQFNRKLRISGGYEYKFRQNTSISGEVDALAHIHKIIFDAKVNLKDRNNVFGKLELVRLQQNGEPGFSAEYELREGLEPGLNAIWQTFVTYYLFGNVELSLTYDGRVSQQRKVIHTGRVQVRAFF